MDLWNLFTSVTAQLPSSRTKDIKTAVRVLTRALGYEDPQTCPPRAYNLPLPQIRHLIDATLIDKGPSTIRNTKQNLSELFRLAEAQQLIQRPVAITTPQYPRLSRPRRTGAQNEKSGLHLARRLWPAPVQDAFSAYEAWATGPAVPNRLAQWRKRPITLHVYEVVLGGFFGYLHHVKHLTPMKFEALFDLPLITDYVHWHVNIHHKRVTKTIEQFLTFLSSLTNQYHQLPDLNAEIRKLKQSIGRPEFAYDKAEVLISLLQVRQVGQALWPCTTTLRYDGTRIAACAGIALMLQLLSYIPLRQRNLREMRKGKNLYQDLTGKWMLRFHGAELKVAYRNGSPNTLELPIPPALVPSLETYLNTWQPLLARQHPEHAHLVFLNSRGLPYTVERLGWRISDTTYRYTGKACHPHLIRTIWATEMLEKGVNVLDVATMLNDKPETVIKRYTHLRTRGVAERMYQLLDQEATALPRKP